MPDLDSHLLLTPAVLLAVLGGLAGLMLLVPALLRSRRGVDPAKQARQELESSEIRDLRKTIYLLQNENRNLSTFLMTLPDLARQLNSSSEKRKIPSLLVNFIQLLFDAQQILVFQTAASGKHLTLAAAKGLPDNVQGQEVVPFGKGRLGWVAEHQITMDENDFAQQSQAAGVGLDMDVHPMFRVELCAPMVAKDHTLGVISVGGLLRRPKYEKNMLKMVADLGSIAIQNTLLFNRIQKTANVDGLTGLHNKRFFMQRLSEELAKAGREQQCLSLFIFDIDHFKNYNDTNGHLAGDEALKISGRLLRENVRDDDLPARYGGEEFIVLLPGTDKDGAAVAAEKVRRVVEQFEYPHQKSQPGGRLTISGGVACYPYDAGDSAGLIRCADQALYAGKRSGRNSICVFKPTYLSEGQAEAFAPVHQGAGQEG